MPILHVRGLPQKNPSNVQSALKQACAAIAEVYGCPVGNVWATWEDIKPGMYVEGLESADQQPAESHPPIAELICMYGRTPGQIEDLLLAASGALSRTLGFEGNIFMTYREAKSGQVVAGNGIVRKS